MSTNKRPPHRLRLSTGALVVASALVLSGCASADTTEPGGGGEPATDAGTATEPGGLEPQPLAEREKVTVTSAIRIENFTALFLADVLGEFEKENLEVEFQQMASADALPALGQGQVSMVSMAPSASFFNAVESGVGVRVVMPCYLNNPSEDGLWVANDVIEEGPKALKGATIASAVGPSSSIVLGIDEYLQSGGLAITDVTIQGFPAPDVPTALIQGAVDAAWVNSPGNILVRESGVADFTNGMPQDTGGVGCAYAFGPDLLEDRPEVGEAMVRAMARTVTTHLQGDYKADPEMVADIATALERTPEEIAQTPSLEFDPELEFRDKDYTRVQELWLEIGDVLSYAEVLDPAQVIERRFVESVLEG